MLASDKESSSAPDTQVVTEETPPIRETTAQSNVSRMEASYWVRQKVVQYLDEMKDALKSAQSGDDEQEIEAWRARVQIVRDILGFLDGMEVKA